MKLDQSVTAWYSVLTNLEAVSLDGSQEGGQPNLTLQVQADLIISYHQPLSCQLHRQTHTREFVTSLVSTEQLDTQAEMSIQYKPERLDGTG